ncbi:hypothetical protein vseg_001501 [Gypsophila vaccaria]
MKQCLSKSINNPVVGPPSRATKKRNCETNERPNKRSKAINGSSSSSSSTSFKEISITSDGKMRKLPLNLVESMRFKEEIKRWARNVVSYANKGCTCSKCYHMGCN